MNLFKSEIKRFMRIFFSQTAANHVHYTAAIFYSLFSILNIFLVKFS